jgi:phage protein D
MATSETAGQAYVQAQAAWRVTLDGKDLTDRFAPRLLSLRLSEKRGEEADELQIEVHDADGRLVLPPEGAVLQVALGWQRGTEVTAGLVPKGSFKVDEIEWSGPADRVSITARAADFADSFRTRKTKVWKDTTLGAIVAEIAGANGIAPACHPDLASKAVTTAEQHNKSDMAFLKDLGRRYDAIAAVKGGKLVFAPVDADTTASGAEIPSLLIVRQRCTNWSFKRAAREKDQDGAEGQWHDQDTAERKTAKAGGHKRRRLKRVYASEGDATAAAESENKRLARAKASFSFTLALGNALVAAGAKATTTGFKTEVDAFAWRIASVEHTMDGRGGFTTSAELEVAG